MSRIRGKDTAPEMRVRRIVHGLGYRFRLHRRDLPGSPDLVLPKHKSVIFVHGCFWHRHPDEACPKARMPKSRQEFWRAKLDSNRARDLRAEAALRALGWKVLVIWECQLGDANALASRVRNFLRSDHEGD